MTSAARSVGYVNLIRRTFDQFVHLPLHADRTRGVAHQEPPSGTTLPQQPLRRSHLAREMRKQVGGFQIAVDVAAHEIIRGRVHQLHPQRRIHGQHIHQPRPAHLGVEALLGLHAPANHNRCKHHPNSSHNNISIFQLKDNQLSANQKTPSGVPARQAGPSG